MKRVLHLLEQALQEQYAHRDLRMQVDTFRQDWAKHPQQKFYYSDEYINELQTAITYLKDHSKTDSTPKSVQ